jgi:hypothetical protein
MYLFYGFIYALINSIWTTLSALRVLICKILANMTQVSDVAPEPLYIFDFSPEPLGQFVTKVCTNILR